MAPLLMPDPRLERSERFGAPAGFAKAGDTAASPDGVVAPLLLAFCASASEPVMTSAAAAINILFIGVIIKRLPA